MIYCDIHTHQAQPASENLCIVSKNIDVRHSLCFLPGCYYSYGIHPWYIEDKDRQLILLTEALFDPTVVALGEAGLDKQIETPMSLQVEVFTEQIKLSEEFRKPLIIHCVKAWDELLAIKKDVQPQMPWIVHGFRGNAIQAQQLIDKGFFLSVGARFNPEVLPVAWPDRLFAETDESDMSIAEIYASMAAALAVSIDLLALTLRKQVKEIFSV